jgi:hypothetical protein
VPDVGFLEERAGVRTHRVVTPVDPVPDHRGEEDVLGGVLAVQRLLGDARAGGDDVHRRAGEAALEEDTPCDREQVSPGASARAPASDGRRIPSSSGHAETVLDSTDPGRVAY